MRRTLCAVGLGALCLTWAAPAHTASAVNVLGTWSITWDWSHGDGGHGTAPISFTPDHIFTAAQSQESGKWTKHGKHLTLHFASSNTCHGTWKATYHKTTGDYAGRMSSTCHGSGTWSMTR
jgi:hypothetical protein